MVARVCAANMRAPLRRIAGDAQTRCRAARPGCRRGTRAAGGTSRRPMMKCAALSAASASIEPGEHRGWLATIATGSPPRWASAQTIGRSEVGLDLEPVPGVEDHVEDARACRTPAAVVARDDRRAARGVARGPCVASDARPGRIRPRARREVRQVVADLRQRVRVVGREVVHSPLGIATDGPPRSCFETSSPIDSFTTGGPAVKIAASFGHDAEVRHRRDQRAVTRPTAPMTPVTTGTDPSTAPASSRSVGERPCRDRRLGGRRLRAA